MKKSLSIRFWIVLLVNILLIPTILLVSLFFYQEFKKTLDERVLLQLTSIKRLKRFQIEDFLLREWEQFKKEDNGSDLLSLVEIQSQFGSQVKEAGVYDVSSINGLNILFVQKKGKDLFKVAVNNGSEIKKILLERSGMGQSGESYLVGSDYRLRSQSRFFPDKPPMEIICKSFGTKTAFTNKLGHGIIYDYRGIEVYSAYHPINFSKIKWAILSEIDTEEALKPLNDLRQKLGFIILIALLIAFAFSVVLARVLTRPLLKMKNYLDQMISGNYDLEVREKPAGLEMQLMYSSLAEMLVKLRSTVNFSKEIGDLNLDADYQLTSEGDTLGRSLLNMREQLRKLNETESSRQRDLRNAIISGQEKERLRLSKELHDGLGPMLTHLKLLIQNQELPKDKKKELKQIIDETVNEVRRMTYNLMPQSLLDFGVEKAVKNLVQTLSPVSKVAIEYSFHSERQSPTFGDDINICLFRIAQECLNNGIKHSQADSILLVITDEGNFVNLYYSDDGVGFDPSIEHNGSGLRNMQARVDVLKGTFAISTGEEGTNIEVNIPYQTK
ncbi:Signal transduction histidine kinase [Spirosomataceae bacterium TFI 002]|nr:Signal transduction histidine kinase [Spirosomataceae bacterium TFI 002]